MNTENTSKCECTNEEYQRLITEQLKVSIMQQKMDLKKSEIHIDSMRINGISNRVEQARRNVEIVAKLVSAFSEDDKIRKKMNEVILENLEVLGEIKNIK